MLCIMETVWLVRKELKMKPYRPENWDNPYLTQWHGEIPCIDGCDVEVFEAGADAILRELEPLIREIAPSSRLVDILYPGEEWK